MKRVIIHNIRAVASNPELSNVVSIHSDKVILWAFGGGKWSENALFGWKTYKYILFMIFYVI
jgi:hypothetical protein